MKHSHHDKVPTRVRGLDEILEGGVPRGRTSLVCGGPGCGKTMMAMEFVARGASEDSAGLFVSFEQTPDQLRADFASVGLGLEELSRSGRLRIHHVDVTDGSGAGAGARAGAGEYTLDGLMLQLDVLIRSLGAERVALDSLESLFEQLGDQPLLRAELRRLFQRLHERGMTTMVTAEAGPTGELTRRGLEEYVSDCVIRLDHRVNEELSTRRARVLKYRGSHHSADEHPFLIARDGISLLPIGSARLTHPAPVERVSSGIAGLDRMLSDEGYFRGSSVLVSGSAGTGKSSIGASYVDAACRRGERALYVAYEESPDQIVRNMSSVGIDLAPWVSEGLLRLQSRRPSQLGLEEHLREIERALDDVTPSAVVVDPITNLINVGTAPTTLAMLTRLVDTLKARGITTIFTALGFIDESSAAGRSGVSSLMDTWIELLSHSQTGAQHRALRIIKSRGMPHDHGVAPLRLGATGLRVGGPRSEPSGAS